MSAATSHPLYATWSGMKARCANPNNKHFPRYGGRGISVCARWLNSLSNFAADMGPRPEGFTLDRINNDGNYEPSNCRWATSTQQLSNRRPYVLRPRASPAREPKPLNMTRRRVEVLALLRAKNRGPTIREMCASLGAVSPNAVHEVLREAAAAGLAETDGKSGGWHLTTHGESVVTLLSTALAEVDALGAKK